MANLQLILVVAAFILEFLAAIPYPPADPWQHRLMAGGLACYFLSLIVR